MNLTLMIRDVDVAKALSDIYRKTPKLYRNL